jgi:hypothetical protein
MGVTIHYALGIASGRVKASLDRTQAVAEEMKREQAAPLAVPFAIRRPSPTKLLIDIGECETLAFDFNAYEQYGETAAGEALRTGRRAWSYEQSVLTRLFDPLVLDTEDDEHYKRWPGQRPLWAAAFCKTQFAAALVEHRWVAELIRSVASVAPYAHVYDEGGYYHTLDIEDAASAIHENGRLINSIGSALRTSAGDGITVVAGGQTKIKPIRPQSDTADRANP